MRERGVGEGGRRTHTHTHAYNYYAQQTDMQIVKERQTNGKQAATTTKKDKETGDGVWFFFVQEEQKCTEIKSCVYPQRASTPPSELITIICMLLHPLLMTDGEPVPQLAIVYRQQGEDKYVYTHCIPTSFPALVKTPLSRSSALIFFL